MPNKCQEGGNGPALLGGMRSILSRRARSPYLVLAEGIGTDRLPDFFQVCD
jgi:hypothetical protein